MTLYNHYMKAPDDEAALKYVKEAASKAVMVGFSLGVGQADPLVILTLPEGVDPKSILPTCELVRTLSLEEVLEEQRREDEQPTEGEG